jgi:S-adenosylmethionine decarboxylase
VQLFSFGSHFMLEGYTADPARLGDALLLTQTLEALPLELELQRVMPAHVFAHKAQFPEDSGLSGAVLMAEGHIAMHTFPERRSLVVDVFSARDFDANKISGVVAQQFEVGRMETRLFHRGKEYPRQIEALERLLMGERDYIEARLSSFLMS